MNGSGMNGGGKANGPLTLAHVSDLQLDGNARARERVARVMKYLQGLTHPVDAIILTGDIADHGLATEYHEALALLPTTVPVFACPGNHDDRRAYREIFLGQPPNDAPVNQVRRLPGAVFLMCDSTIPGQPGGFLSDETIGWLDSTLGRRRGVPAFVCFHHPPVTLHSPFIDPIRQSGGARVADVITRYPDVVAILCGHAHTGAATMFAGRPLLVAPGVASTLKLPWEHEEKWKHSDVLDRGLPPAVAFHVVDSERRVTTHYRVVP